MYILNKCIYICLPNLKPKQTMKHLLITIALAMPLCLLVSAQNVILTSEEDIARFNHSIIQGDLIISGSDIVRIEGLNSLIQIKGNLFIRQNPKLLAVNGLKNLRSVGQSNEETVQIANNPLLQSIEGFDNLRSIFSLDISDNEQLTQLEDFDMLRTIEHTLVLSNNPKLTAIPAMQSVRTVGHAIRIIGCNGLSHVNGLENVSGTLNEIVLINNTSLSDISALNNITRVEEGSITINNNDQLVNLNGLERIEYVYGLKIRNNKQLKTLSSLSNIQLVGSDLEVHNNSNLYHLEGLENIRQVGGYLKITNNEQLASCCAIQDVLLNQNVLGTILIENNPNTCSNQGGVEVTACVEIDSCALRPTFSIVNEINDAGEMTIEVQDQTEYTQGDEGTTIVWDFGDGSSSTESNPTYTYAQNGTYIIELNVSQQQCTVSTTQIVSAPVVFKSVDAQLSPNPTNGAFSIAVDQLIPGQQVDIVIHDRMGKKVLEQRTDIASFATLEQSFHIPVRTRLELATSCVTGRHSNQLNYRTKI